jgi:hypothetical protein
MTSVYGETLGQDTHPNLEEDMIEKLVRKISLQAVQLASMEKALRNSAEYIHICEGRVRNLEIVRKSHSVNVETASDQSLTHVTPNVRNEHDMAIQLKDAEECVIKSRCRIIELEKELRGRERQWKLSESKVTELRNELLKTKGLLQSSQHTARLSPKSSGTAYSHVKTVAGLKSEIASLRAYLTSYQTRLESSKKTQRALALRVGALEDQIDNMPPSMKYTDLEMKARTLAEKLRDQNSKLREGGTDPMTDISQAKGHRADSEYDFAGPLFPNDSSMVTCSDSPIEKDHQTPYTLIPGRSKIDGDMGEEGEKSVADPGGTKLRAVLRERDVLLEFIQVTYT